MKCSVRRTWWASGFEAAAGEGEGSVGCGGRPPARARDGTTAAAMPGGGRGGQAGGRAGEGVKVGSREAERKVRGETKL